MDNIIIERIHTIRQKLREDIRKTGNVDPKDETELRQLLRKYQYADEIGSVE